MRAGKGLVEISLTHERFPEFIDIKAVLLLLSTMNDVKIANIYNQC